MSNVMDLSKIIYFSIDKNCKLINLFLYLKIVKN